MSLRERRELVSLYRGHGGSPDGVLFSLTEVAGSSYRQPGARMMSLPDGRSAGTLSGGCLEADLLRRAPWMVRAGAVTEHFSTFFDETAEIPYGLGCGGEVDVLLEPLGTAEAAALLTALDATLQGSARTVATVLPHVDPGGSTPLYRIVLDSRNDVLFASDALPTEDVVRIRLIARRAEPGKRTFRVSDERGCGAPCFVERLEAAQRLVIFGAGEDARPLARLAYEMGWLPVVADTRAARATAERFPGAECLVASHAADVPVLPSDAVVLMTHSYRQDRHLLAELLQTPPVYLGLLGARHRSALLLQEASQQAGVALDVAVSATHSPVGLDLGGEGPEAIALAIVAEVQQVLCGSTSRAGVPSRRMVLRDVEQSLRNGPGSATFERCALSGDVAEQASLPVAAR